MEGTPQPVRIKVEDVEEDERQLGVSDKNELDNSYLKRKAEEDDVEENFSCSKKFVFGVEQELIPFSESGDLNTVRLFQNRDLDINDLYNKYTENGNKPLVISSTLVQRLRENGDPLRMKPGIENPSNYIFIIGLWDHLLKTAILNGIEPPEEIIILFHSFIPEMRVYREETNFERFPCYVYWVAERGLRSIDEWGDLPSVLRILAPLNEQLLEANPAKQLIFSEMLKSLPHGVLMMPWRDFDPKNFVRVKTATDVSTPEKKKFFSSRFLICS